MGRVSRGIRHDYKLNPHATPPAGGQRARPLLPVAIAITVLGAAALAALPSRNSDGPEVGTKTPTTAVVPGSEPQPTDAPVEPAMQKPRSGGAAEANHTARTIPLELPARATEPAPAELVAEAPPVARLVGPVPAGDAKAPGLETTPASSAEPMADTEIAGPSATPVETGTLVSLEVRRGDSLDKLFRRNGISTLDLAYIMKLDEAARHLKTIRPGDRIEIRHDGETVLTLSRPVGDLSSLFVERDGDGFRARIFERTPDVRIRTAHGTISTSLYEAGMEAGLTDTTIMNLAGIFAWDVDFALDIRKGDGFSVVYEERWLDGQRLKDGRVLAAEFQNQGDAFRAVRYQVDEENAEYYTPEGDSVRKAFLRAPVDFRRVSSNFNMRRLHPVLKVSRPHRGVDYAASTGTPIKAAGDGRIIHRGRKGGYGNTVILQHGGNITTLYAHMSKFATKQRVGSRVRQGQVIGYVGKTGLASGPHLHYEYRVNGVHRNPRTVELPEADPVDPRLRDDFLRATAPLVAELDALNRIRLAAAN